MTNTLVHQTQIIDAIDCGTAAELLAAVENMGMSLDLARDVRVTLIEEILSDGSKVQSIQVREG